MNWRVLWTSRARADLDRLVDYKLERELARNAAGEGGDFELHLRVMATLEESAARLDRTALACRRSIESAHLRELVVPFGSSGYVILFEVTGEGGVIIVAMRHQLERDYRRRS